jgi:hypothetical protein
MLQSLTKKLPILVSFCLVNSYNFLPAIAVDVCAENLTKGEYKITITGGRRKSLIISTFQGFITS